MSYKKLFLWRHYIFADITIPKHALDLYAFLSQFIESLAYTVIRLPAVYTHNVW